MARAAEALDRTFAALADPRRRRVVDRLRAGPRRAGELAAAEGLSAPAMSRHLRVLRLGGVIEEERADPADSRVRLYRLRRQPFARLRGWLDDVEAGWSEQLAAFKAHAEKGGRP